MSARILVVDDIQVNRRLLEARLTAEYFDVLQADCGEACLKIAAEEQPDLILLDVMMPGIDGFETCRQLKSNSALRHIPVIIVTALDYREDRIRGLQAGADDFLTKPIDDVAMFARVRSLLRLKSVMDELQVRDDSTPVEPTYEVSDIGPANVMVLTENLNSASRISRSIDPKIKVQAICDPAEGVRNAETNDLLIVDLSSPRIEGLRFCARIRSDSATRQTPILGIVSAEDQTTMVRALDLGVNDVISRPLDGGELSARISTLIQRKNYTDALRGRLQESLELAVTDSLTGLYNRRHVMSSLSKALDRFHNTDESVSVGLFDLDNFKSINDTYGHQVGDAVLKEFSHRLGKELRALDVAGRYGGEEFLIVFVNSSLAEGLEACERIRQAVANEPFVTNIEGLKLEVTVSVGVSVSKDNDDMDVLIARADSALYDAKRAGRNQVKNGNLSAA